jgi:hypothetical protein
MKMLILTPMILLAAFAASSIAARLVLGGTTHKGSAPQLAAARTNLGQIIRIPSTFEVIGVASKPRIIIRMESCNSCSTDRLSIKDLPTSLIPHLLLVFPDEQSRTAFGQGCQAVLEADTDFIPSIMSLAPPKAVVIDADSRVIRSAAGPVEIKALLKEVS